jgi:hypothetical protein
LGGQIDDIMNPTGTSPLVLEMLALFNTITSRLWGKMIAWEGISQYSPAVAPMHLRAVLGVAKTMLDTLAELMTRRTEPRTKLH